MFRGLMGYGAASHIHTAKILRLSEDLPVLVEIVDGADKIAAFLPIIDEMVKEGLIHHSDRGVQYASTDYTDALKTAGIKISMSRRANPYDNAQMERFLRTLKYEAVYLREYENLSEARACIGQFIEQVYNQKRLHSALGYVAPVEFEQALKQQPTPP